VYRWAASQFTARPAQAKCKKHQGKPLSSSLFRATQRYREYRLHTRELIEEAAFRDLRMRVDVTSIDEDILRRAERDWYGHPDRKVGWDWTTGIMEPLWGCGAARLDLAFLVKGQLCGMAVARVSRQKRWISLTHVEASAADNPLKGSVLTLVVYGLYVFRSQICHKNPPHCTGIRALNPLEAVVPYYGQVGYPDHHRSKRLNQVVMEWPLRDDDDEDRYAKDAGCKTHSLRDDDTQREVGSSSLPHGACAGSDVA
jgi:hypothetical protein